MIAQLPPDTMPSPHPEAIPRFQRLFRDAGGLHIDKSDVKRYEDFADRKIYDLLLRGEDNARAVGAKSIQLWHLPITAGLRASILAFREIDESIELQPIIDRLAKQPPLHLSYGDTTVAALPEIFGGLGVALARAFGIIDPHVKNPQTGHWDRATRIFDLLL
jgi:hypothetical protein